MDKKKVVKDKSGENKLATSMQNIYKPSTVINSDGEEVLDEKEIEKRVKEQQRYFAKDGT